MKLLSETNKTERERKKGKKIENLRIIFRIYGIATNDNIYEGQKFKKGGKSKWLRKHTQ